MEVIEILRRNGTPIAEVVTAGTPTLPCSLSYAAFANNSFTHRVSPGTLVYSDSSSATVIPRDRQIYRPAAIIATRVVSHPSAGRITCDAGHKSLSVDTGVPNCTVISRVTRRLSCSEEHLPIDLPACHPN